MGINGLTSTRHRSRNGDGGADIDVIDLRVAVPGASVWVEPLGHDNQGRRVARLRAEDVTVLHEFVEHSGLDAGCVIGRVSTHTHYVLSPRQRRHAITCGALPVEWTVAYQRIARATVVGTRPPSPPRATRSGVRRAARSDVGFLPPDGARTVAVISGDAVAC